MTPDVALSGAAMLQERKKMEPMSFMEWIEQSTPYEFSVFMVKLIALWGLVLAGLALFSGAVLAIFEEAIRIARGEKHGDEG